MSEAKIGLVYGTESGNTEDIANKIRAGMVKHGHEVDLYDVKDAEVDEYLKYDLLIYGHTDPGNTAASRKTGKTLRTSCWRWT